LLTSFMDYSDYNFSIKVYFIERKRQTDLFIWMKKEREGIKKKLSAMDSFFIGILLFDIHFLCHVCAIEEFA
jgi:hypothetical protein